MREIYSKPDISREAVVETVINPDGQAVDLFPIRTEITKDGNVINILKGPGVSRLVVFPQDLVKGSLITVPEIEIDGKKEADITLRITRLALADSGSRRGKGS